MLSPFWIGLFLAAAQVPVDIPYQRFVLDNGLTLIVHEDHKAPIVAVNIWYHVGSKNERAGRTGFAHLFEHLMFNGSQHFNDDYFQVMERIGATDMNGTTNNDRTNFFQNVPASALDTALWMESDRMGYLLGAIDQKRLDEQRGVVQNEKREGENQPYGRVDDLVEPSVYPAAHPYSWTVIGSMEDLNGAAIKDVQEWFKTYYGPQNATLVLAGDIDATTALAKVKKYFGALPAGPPAPKQRVWVARRQGVQRQTYWDNVAQPRLYKIWNVPEYGETESDYLDLVGQLLSQGKSSRLYKRLVYDEQIATAVNAYVDTREIGSLFYIEVTARPGQDLARVEKEVDEELAKLFASGPDAAETERARTQYIASFVRGKERIGGFGGKSDTLATGQVYRGDPDFYKTILRHVEQATPADLKNVAQRWLSDGAYVLDVLPSPAYTISKNDADRSKVPEPGSPPELKLPALQRATLSNGVKIVLAERHGVPIVNLALLLDAGYASDQFATPGTARLAMATLTSGTARRSALAISDEIDRLGAQLNARSNLDLSVVSLSSLKWNLDPSLDLFADVILHPAFPQDDFLRQQKLQAARIQQEKVTPIMMALRVFPGLLYGKAHAYGNPLTGSGTEASTAKLARADLVKFHDTWFKPNHATLIVVGDTSIAEMQPRLEKLFADWKPGPIPEKTLPEVAQQAKSTVYLIDKPGAVQSVVLAGAVAPRRGTPADIPIETMNNILGGVFTSRVNMNLREDKHWAYGAFTLFWDARGQRPFIAYAPVQTDKTKESVSELNKELHAILGDRPASAAELAKAQANQTLSLPGSQETNEAILESVQNIVQFGLPDDYYQTYPKAVKALTTGSLADAAKSALHPDNLVWVVVGDRSKIENGIRDLHLGEVRMLDPDGNPTASQAQ